MRPATVSALAAATLFCVAATAHAQQKASLPGVEGFFFLRADGLTYDNKNKVFTASGHVEITSRQAVVHADKAVMYEEDDVLEAEGHVALFDGKNLVFAQKARLKHRGLVGTLLHGTIIVKKSPDPETLKRLDDPVCAKRIGRNRLYLEGEQIDREGERHYRLIRTEFTPCDCGDEPPSWKISTLRAWVDLDEQATMVLPVFYADDVPVMVLPALMFPVGERRTGFLFPRFGYTGRDGVQLNNAFYLTLGKSADATFEADWLQDRGIKWGLETRYAPTKNITGRFYGTFISDTKEAYDRDRWSIQHTHKQTLGDRFYFNDQIHLVSDATYVSDFMFDIWEREAEYTKSDVNLVKDFDDVFLGTGVVFYQDLKRGGHDLFDRFGARTVQRLPWASFGLAMKEVPGMPLAFSLDAGYVNYFDPVQKYADVGSDRMGYNDFGYSQPDTNEFNHRYDPGEPIRRVNRFTLYPTVLVPLNLASYAKWSTSFSYRHSIYQAEVSKDFPMNAGYGVLRSGLETDVWRAFAIDGDETAAVRHAFVPGAEYRYVPFTFRKGGQPVLIDEIDAVTGIHQVMFSLHNRLDYKRKWGQYGRWLDVGLYQGVDLDPAPEGERLSPLGIEVMANVGGFSTREYVGYEWSGGTGVSEFASTNSISDRRGDSVSLGYNYLPRSGRTHFSQGLEELFASRFDPRLKAFGKIDEIIPSTNVKIIKGLFVSYAANYSFLIQNILYQSFGLRYTSPCDCWSLSAAMNIYHWQDMPDFLVTFDLSNLGNIKG